MDWWARLSTEPIPGGTKQKRAQAPATALGPHVQLDISTL